MDLDIVALARLQFALTALYHFLFVPLTLGLSVIVAISRKCGFRCSSCCSSSRNAAIIGRCSAR